MAEEGQVCCCGTNKGWLMFMVGLNIFSCVIGMFLSVIGIVAIKTNKLEPGTEEAQQVALIFLSVILVACAILFLINLLPIIAEIKKKPKLHLAYRNWIILHLIFQVLGLIVSLAGVGPQTTGTGGLNGAAGAENNIANRIVSLLVTIFTLVLVHRRMNELQGEIGQMSFLKFM